VFGAGPGAGNVEYVGYLWSAQQYHTGKFVSPYDAFLAGQVCIEGVCVSRR
jgi:hypothetical protein